MIMNQLIIVAGKILHVQDKIAYSNWFVSQY